MKPLRIAIVTLAMASCAHTPRYHARYLLVCPDREAYYVSRGVYAQADSAWEAARFNGYFDGGTLCRQGEPEVARVR